MALDASIPLQAFKGLPDIGAKVSNALQNVQRGQQIAQNREQAPLRNQLLEAQAGTAESQQALAATQAAEADRNRRLGSLAEFGLSIGSDVDRADLQGILAKTTARRNTLIDQGLPTEETDDLISLIGRTDISEDEKLQEISGQRNDIISSARQFGVLKPEGGAATAGERTRIQLLQDLKSDDPQVAQSAEVALGLRGRKVGSAAQTIAETGTAGDVGASQAEIKRLEAEGVEVGKAKGLSKSAPLIAQAKSSIASAVKIAEIEAKDRGEALTGLNRARASLPGLTEVIGKLKELAPIATSTLSGRAFDVIAKEIGFGATKGKVARTKFGAMINNQVLPLLRDTFGAAFTAQEGESLRATMGDINATPEEKMATLDAFIEQKQREIETKELQLNPQPKAGGVLMTDANGNTALVFPDGTFEEQ